MKYAIEQLRQYASIMSSDKITKGVTYDFNQSADALERGDKKYKHSIDVIHFLHNGFNHIKYGLDNLEGGYQEEKKRQQKRLKDYQEAINFIEK
jgi:hypothetical protein